MAVKYFECANCDAQGNIKIKDKDIQVSDIVYCPICGADIFEDDDLEPSDE